MPFIARPTSPGWSIRNGIVGVFPLCKPLQIPNLFFEKKSARFFIPEKRPVFKMDGEVEKKICEPKNVIKLDPSKKCIKVN